MKENTCVKRGDKLNTGEIPYGDIALVNISVHVLSRNAGELLLQGFLLIVRLLGIKEKKGFFLSLEIEVKARPEGDVTIGCGHWKPPYVFPYVTEER